MPDNELLTVIDERLAMALPLIEEIQENYLKNNGVYAQGLFTHSSVPEEDEMVSPDSLDSSPTDQDETWDDLDDAGIFGGGDESETEPTPSEEEVEPVEDADEVEDTTEEEPVADEPEPAPAAEPEPLDDVTDDDIDSLFGPA